MAAHQVDTENRSAPIAAPQGLGTISAEVARPDPLAATGAGSKLQASLDCRHSAIVSYPESQGYPEGDYGT
ncbi:MAG: hypothetical protein NZ772_15140 [Cyanobacteria bacterium]|nr:hypothetical protein [Cyanobacteriota bacterium]MDW8202651.1 hypothetical protein [Cyanobacteriota bacterium SKYGB_h_bin112]